MFRLSGLRDLRRLRCWALSACVAGLCLSAPATAAARLAPLGSLIPSASGELLGATAISGATTFASAPQATFDASDQGAVFAFDEPSGGWSGTANESAVLTASSPSAGQRLGESLSASGQTVAAASAGGDLYVFTQPPGGWVGTVHEVATLTASDGATLSNPIVSGQTIFAQGARTTAPGAVYVFTEPSGGWSGTLHESARLTASDGYQYDGLGDSIAVDGSTVVAGAPGARVGSDTPGAVYVFTEPAGGWSGVIHESAKLTGSDVSTHVGAPVAFATEFASEVAISGSTIAAVLPFGPPGVTGAVYVFSEPSGGWHSETQSAKLTAPNDLISAANPISTIFSGGGLQGLSVSGDTIAVPGSLGSTLTHPVVFVYTEPAGGWSGNQSESATLEPPGINPFTGGTVGTPVISGQTVLAGAFRALSDQTIVGTGSSYVFDEPSGGWSGTIAPSATLTGAGGLATGGEYVFAEPSGGWADASQNATIAPSGNPSPVSFSSASLTGTTAVAAGDTGTYVFSEPLGGWANAKPAGQLVDPGGELLSGVTQSGTTIAALARPSAYAQDAAVDVFDQPGTGWSGQVQPVATLTPSDGAVLSALAISGRTVVALGDDPTPAVYIFSEPAGGWSGAMHETARVAVPQYSQPALIGAQGDTVVLGGTISGSTIVAHGTAYVLVEPAGGWSSAARPTATLNAPAWEYQWLHVYEEPPGGWSGMVQAAARLVLSPNGYYPATFALSGSTIAIAAYVPGYKGSGCPCGGGVWLFSEPPQGWHGILTARPSTQAYADYDGNVALAIDGGTVLAGGQTVPGPFSDTDTGVFAVTQPILESALHPGRVTAGQLRANELTVNDPGLAFSIHAGAYAPPVQSMTVGLPRGLRFSRSGVDLQDGLSLGIPVVAPRIVRGRLIVRLAGVGNNVRIRLDAPALVESAAFQRKVKQLLKYDSVRRHRHKRRLRITLSLQIVDAAGHARRFAISTAVPRP